MIRPTRATLAEVPLADLSSHHSGQPAGNGPTGPQLVVVDLHEARSINAGVKERDGMGFGIESLLPRDRTGTEEPRYKTLPGRQRDRT